jgi:type II secretory pathway component PulC
MRTAIFTAKMGIAAFLALLIFIAASPYALGSENFKYDMKNKRDPFRPLVDKDGNILPEARPAAAAVELNLEGIVWSRNGDSYAIVGGSVVRAGDILGDYKVKNIEKTRVILDRGGQESVINLRGEEE